MPESCAHNQFESLPAANNQQLCYACGSAIPIPPLVTRPVTDGPLNRGDVKALVRGGLALAKWCQVAWNRETQLRSDRQNLAAFLSVRPIPYLFFAYICICVLPSNCPPRLPVSDLPPSWSTTAFLRLCKIKISKYIRKFFPSPTYPFGKPVV